MKRIKSTQEITNELRLFFNQKGAIGSSSIANLSEIGQSQIHRNLFGSPKRLTKTLKGLCEYAKISLYKDVDLPDPASSAILMKALTEVWDGSDEQARRISRFLFALKHVDM